MESQQNQEQLQKTVKCPHCQKNQVVLVSREPPGLGQLGHHSITCVYCEKPWAQLLPGPIVGGPFLA